MGKNLQTIARGRQISSGLVKAYQYLFKPWLGQHCRFYPSCSDFALEVLKKHRLPKACALITWRLLCCNPWCKRPMYDPVP